MEYIYPEIALKQPKADPRTVLLHKRKFLESSSDHIPEEEFQNDRTTTTTKTTAKCDKLINLYKNSKTAISETKLVFKKSLASSLLLSTKSSSSLLSNILVNFSKSCHFNASSNNLYKLQKTRLLFFSLLFIWCAIFLQTTQAIPVRRTTTSGRKLILHTNVYRERYHQKLLEERNQHNQQQKLLQIQQQLEEIKEQQYLQQQQLQQVQRNHIYSPTKLLRRVPALHHRHHLHQRAAPSTLITSAASNQHKKMSNCSRSEAYENLRKQINNSLPYLQGIFSNYLKYRENETIESMSETWKLQSLKTRNPNRKSVPIDNELNKKIHNFYLNLHNFDQLIAYANNDTINNRTIIEHGEEISITTITKFFEDVKTQINFNMREALDVLTNSFGLEEPNLNDNTVVFDETLGRKVRDFLIIKGLLAELENVENFCENNQQEEE